MAKNAAKGVRLENPGGDDIAQVFSLSGPSLSNDPVEVSTHESVKFYREFVPGFRDAGEVTIGLRFDPAEDTHSEIAGGLLQRFELDSAPLGWIIRWPNAEGSTWSFAAIVTGYEPSADFDAALEAQVTLKLTGAPTFIGAP